MQYEPSISLYKKRQHFHWSPISNRIMSTTTAFPTAQDLNDLQGMSDTPVYRSVFDIYTHLRLGDVVYVHFGSL